MALVAKIRPRNRYGEGWSKKAGEDRKLLGNRCERCGTGPTPGNPLHRHHIIHRSKKGSNAPINLKIFCRQCHEWEHNKR